MKKNWDDIKLSSALRNAIDELGFVEPTEIQAQVFSAIMSGQDVCGIAQTGTGKTLAYLIPSIMLWKFSKEKEPQIIVVVPTRELVVQVIDEIKSLTTYMNITAIGVFGGVGLNRHKLELENGCDILVGTPGRMFDLMMVRAFKTKNIKRVVIDEVDEMLALGFRNQLNSILDLIPQKRQNLLFSATMQSDVAVFIKEHFTNLAKIEVDTVGKTVDNIEQIVFETPNFNTKINLLQYLINQTDAIKILVFVSTKKMADRVYNFLLPKLEQNVSVIHSNKEQSFRFRAIEDFETGKSKVLIATDILARGIDVLDITHVINFDTPDIEENYIHRIGRTGRAKKTGVAITFCNAKEKEYLDLIEKFINISIPKKSIPDEVEISDEVLPFEMDKSLQKELNANLPKVEKKGEAFHQKLDKNKKVNVKVTRKEKMMAKYGKPITKGKKKK